VVSERFVAAAENVRLAVELIRAAQTARFTASGAPSGAAAWPKRRRARVPGTVGPDDGKIFAFADDTIMAKTAALIRILGLRGYTSRFRSVSYAIRIAFAKKKVTFSRPFGHRSR